jgi:hypothetical protein
VVTDVRPLVPAEPVDEKPALQTMPVSIRGLVRAYGGIQGDPLAWTVRQIPGGMRAVLRLLQLSTTDPEAQHFVAVHRRLSHEVGGDVAIAEVLQEAQMQARDFVGMVSRCAFDFNIAMGKTIAAMHYPKLMKASVKRALEAEATDERKMHFQATGYLPTAKGIQVGIVNHATALPDDRPPEPGRPASFDRTARQVVRTLPGE